MDDEDLTFLIELPDGDVVIGKEDVAALQLMLPMPGAPAKLRTRRLAEPDDTDVLLFGSGLIDCFGNVTIRGEIVVATYVQWQTDVMDAALAALEMAELDRLDAACRRRPRASRYDG